MGEGYPETGVNRVVNVWRDHYRRTVLIKVLINIDCVVCTWQENGRVWHELANDKTVG